MWLLAKTRFIRGLRFRLTITNVIFLSALLIALGFFFRGVLSSILDGQVRDVLNEDWGAVKGYLVIHRREASWQFDPTDAEESYFVNRLQRVFLVTDSKGKVLSVSPMYQSLGVQSAEEITAALKTKEPYWHDRRSPDGEPFRIRGGVFIDDKDQVHFAAIGYSLAENERVLEKFTRDYYLLLPLFIVSGSLLGWLVSGRAIRPVNELALAAERISGTNLSLRIPLRNSGDEIDNLIQTFNGMVERLEQSFQMTRQFSADVSHELRTPLTSIRGELEVALFTAKTKEQYRDAMINALEDVERLSQTIRAMLLLSQAESGQLLLQKARMDLVASVLDIVDQFQIPAEEAQVTLRSEISATAFIEADRIQIDRMISNLLSNAVKYTPSGGSITARVYSHNGWVVFEVEDTGMGIAPEYLPHIFDRFYRVPGSSKEKQGLGLGLSFVAWIVKAHNGTLDVQSVKGKGTCFTVKLPANSAVVAAIEPVEISSAQAPTSTTPASGN